MNRIQGLQISQNSDIRTAIKQMDAGGIGFIAINRDDGTMAGILTDGDFRRAVLKGVSLSNNIMEIANSSFRFVEKSANSSIVDRIFAETRVRHLPVLENGKMVELLLRENVVSELGTAPETDMSPVDVVIMAGGLGTRLKPFTTILPKPLTPVGDRSILEVIMEKFARYGMTRFRLSVGHKVKLLKAYLEDLNHGYSISFVDEDQPLGTAGALRKLYGVIGDSFFVSNCDIIIDDNYAAMYRYHKEHGFALTVICSMQHHTIPYGVCEIAEGGVLRSITEKPQFDFLVNTGFYILEPHSLGLIPADTFFNMTDLITKLQEKGQKIGVFPVSEKAWLDIGQLDEYVKTLDRLNLLVK